MKINAVYFSCGRDQDMLNLSIDSLRRNWNINQVFVASDNRDPVTKRLPDVTYIEKENSSEKLYGLSNIREMHEVFARAVMELGVEDYILKIDSDVLCCSDLAFRRLQDNNWDAYGGFPMAIESMIPPGHFNGNAYFLKKHLANIISICPFGEESERWAWMNYPEDMVTSSLCNLFTENIQVDWTAQTRGGNYLFDIFLTRVAEQPKEKIKEYGFAHCRTNPRVLEYLHKKLYA